MSAGADDGQGATSGMIYVYDKDLAWVPARLVSQTGDSAKVSIPTYEDEASILTDGGKGAKSWREETVSLKTYPGKQFPLQNIKGGQLVETEDMVDLPFLHEAAILYNLKARHVRSLPYTRTGDIVIAMNPYQWLTDIYTESVQQHYSQKLVWEASETDPRRLLHPHVYETSSLSYKGLAVDGMSQSILVSGESGAGKTETVKICMNHIASVQQGPTSSQDPNEGINKVVQRVVESNPLLEAFGNAKTRRNDNSSRFGKYIQLQFDRRPLVAGERVPATKLAGSKCEVYLLEKSRIVGHDDVEGTFHIFYQLLAAKDQDKIEIWSILSGKKPKDFKYVGHHSYERAIDGKSDGDHYYQTVDALALIDVKGEKLMTLMRAIAIVMQLGQITFGPKGGDPDSSAVTSKSDFSDLAQFMGLPENDFELSLTERTMVTRGETFKVKQNAATAKDSCDAFAKEIYAKTFLWLVREINAATCAEDNYDGARHGDFGTIGLLDIFGFESFPVNGFEQLCINYANEKLQQKFTRDIFQTVMEEYKFEGLALDDIKYDDNSDVLDLIEGRGGLLAMLNEECVRPKGNDTEFVYKATNANKTNKILIKEALMGPCDFGIHHYAGKVQYYAVGFVSRNQDTLPTDLSTIAKRSNNEIIAGHLENEKMMKSESAADKAAVAVAKGPRRGKSNIAGDTVWTKFRSQLNSLMKMLNETQSRYVRCIKPNTVKKPRVLQHMTTVEQLRCAGVVAAVTISRSAFPNRLDHRSCVERFKMLQKGASKEDLSDAEASVTKLLSVTLAPLKNKGVDAFVVGKTRVYFRAGALEFLENERMKGWDKWAVDIQRCTRGWLVRRKNSDRKMKKRAPFATSIQCAWRCYAAKRHLKRLRKLKKHSKKLDKMMHKAAAKIQACVRTMIWRPKYLKMVKQKREKEALKTKIKELEAAVREAEKARQKEVEEARAKAEEEMEQYRKKIKEELANDKEKQKKSAQQQTLIDESGKIIEYLRKENMKLRNQNEIMRKDFKALKENNARLMEANASAGASFSALNDHAKQLNISNAKLIRNVEAYKQQLEKLKDDLKTRQAYYLAEAEARLAYQKTMAQIVGAIQDKCRDAQLVEDVVIMALECEAEAKAERAALEAATSKTKSSSSSASKTSGSKGSTPSLAKTEADDSDSDSD